MPTKLLTIGLALLLLTTGLASFAAGYWHRRYWQMREEVVYWMADTCCEKNDCYACTMTTNVNDLTASCYCL